MLSKNEQKLDLSNKNYGIDSSELKEYCSKYPNITELDISNNNLVAFPDALLGFIQLTSLDVKNNPFENFDEIVHTIAKYTNLTTLEIDLINKSQAFMILNEIPKLILLNGKSTKDNVTIIDLDDKEIEDLALQSDPPVFNELLTSLTTVYQNNSVDYVKEYERKILEGKETINNCIKSNSPNYIYANNIIQSQLITQKHLSQRFITFLGTIDEESKSIGEKLFECIFKTAETSVDIINTLYPKIEEKTQSLRNQLEDVMRNADEIGDYEERYKNANKEKDTIAKQYENEREIIQNKLERLETENKLMTDKLFKNAKDICNNNPKANTIQAKSIQAKTIQSHNSNKNNQSFNQASGSLTISQSLSNSNHLHHSLISHQNNNNPMTSSNILIGPTSSKMITMKIMKEKINEIYASKAEYDKKCQDNKLPRETMEQHMYTYLTQKYGLKNMIIEWASSIINGIKQYSSEDSDINLFGKILRNEQEEDSRFIISRLRTTIVELLEYYIKSKNSHRTLKEIKKLVEEKTQGSLKEEEWKGILYYIYSNEDAQNIETKLSTLIQKSKEKNTQYSNKNMTREEMYKKLMEEPTISYKDFIKVVTDYQIKARDKYLKNFVQLFKKCDTDEDGVINENEFIELIKLIPICRDNVDEYAFKFLSIIDPFNRKQITFSECITLLSMKIDEVIDNNQVQSMSQNQSVNEKDKAKESTDNKPQEEKEMSFLDKISQENNE